MANAGFDVPGGFCLTATAYRNFIEANDLQAKINELARPEIGEYTLSFDAASQSIQALIGKPDLSDEIKNEIRQTYAALDGENPAVAIRSSANAEDLPDLSFADQQDTYLNIITPATRMMKALEAHPDGKPIVEAIDEYLGIYGHLGYSLDFAEPLPLDDPSGVLSTSKTMISNKDYDPKNHEMEAKKRR